MKSLVGAAVTLCLLSSACSVRSGASDPPRVEPAEATTPAAQEQSTAQAVPTEPSGESAPAGLRTQLAPGDHELELRNDRRDRRYIVHVPPTVTVPAPVVIALHGGGGTGADFQDQNGLDAIADREGFIAIYPEGTGVLPNRLHTWNSGEHCCGFAFDRDIDDVGFLRAVIKDVANHIETDAGRIYMTGHSNGAMMAYRFAVEQSDLVAAIVPVGGAVDLAQPDPSQRVALLHIHSLDDPRAIYEGGQGPAFPGTDRSVHHEPVLVGIERWAATAGCESTSEIVESAVGTGADAGHRVDRYQWQGCPADAIVEHLVLAGSGHGWPGVTAPRIVQRHLGPPTNLVNASEEVWAFVSQFER